MANHASGCIIGDVLFLLLPNFASYLNLANTSGWQVWHDESIPNIEVRTKSIDYDVCHMCCFLIYNRRFMLAYDLGLPPLHVAQKGAKIVSVCETGTASESLRIPSRSISTPVQPDGALKQGRFETSACIVLL